MEGEYILQVFYIYINEKYIKEWIKAVKPQISKERIILSDRFKFPINQLHCLLGEILIKYSI